MTLKRFLNIVSPFTLLSIAGLYTVGIGLVHWGRENNALQFIFGIPLIVIPLLFHFLIVRVLQHQAGRVWLVEGFFVAMVRLLFYYRW